MDTDPTLQPELIQAVNVLKETIPRMNDLRIPVIPENYAVWYEYALGSTPALNREIDDLLNRGSEFTRAINSKLYQEQIAHHSTETLEMIQTDTSSLVSQIMRKLQVMSQGTQSFSRVLDESQESLQSELDISYLSSLVNGLVNKVGQVQETNSAVEDALGSMNKELDTLKNDLANMSTTALTDPLTGIANRRAFDDAIEALHQTYKAEQPPFSLIMIDIDHFKQFNDTHGHTVGDKVLIFFAKILQQCIKGGDIAARYGGEEFSILLPETSHKGAMALAEQLREKISRKKLILSQGERKSLGNITASMGVAEISVTDDVVRLIERADKALYQAKAEGRNRVVGAPVLISQTSSLEYDTQYE